MISDNKKATELAKFTVGWWQGHHRKDMKSLKKNLINEHVLLHNIKRKDAVKAVAVMMHAGFCHDMAEKYEDSGRKLLAKREWKRVEKLLKIYYLNLLSSKPGMKK